MNNPLIITIGREYGSGGHQIGQAVAERLGVKFYDKQIISLAAQKSGLSDEFIANNEQRVRSGLMQNLAASAAYSSGFFSGQYLPLSESIFISQAQVIRDVAATESAVIVGRCADYVLAGRGNTINVFIHADDVHRAVRVSEMTGSTTATEIQRLMAKKDASRHNYYNHYTGKKWGDSHNYHMTLDSGALGYDTCVKLIVAAAQAEA